jgi:hypothetical protein
MLPHLAFFYWHWVLQTVLPRLAWNPVLLISAFYIARITDKSHQHPATFSLIEQCLTALPGWPPNFWAQVFLLPHLLRSWDYFFFFWYFFICSIATYVWATKGFLPTFSLKTVSKLEGTWVYKWHWVFWVPLGSGANDTCLTDKWRLWEGTDSI